MILGSTVGRILPDDPPETLLRRTLNRFYNRDFTAPVALSAADRYRGVLLVGPTGKGKSASFLVPSIARDLMNGSAHAPCVVAVDVKSPQMGALMGALCSERGKPCTIIDPWAREWGSGIEPLRWSDRHERAAIVAALRGTTPDGRSREFFSDTADRLLRAVCGVVAMGPRSHCSLPAVAQVISGGADEIRARRATAADRIQRLGRPDAADKVRDAIIDLLDIPEARLRSGLLRGRERAALELVESYGRAGRDLIERMKAGDRSVDIAAVLAGVVREYDDDLVACDATLDLMFDMPKETFDVILSTANSWVQWIDTPEISTALSRDDVRLHEVLEVPGLLSIGAQMGKMQYGSMEFASVVMASVTSILFRRGTRDEGATPPAPVIVYMDEAGLVADDHLPTLAAVARSHRVGLVICVRGPAQVRNRWGEQGDVLLANLATHVVLPGLHRGAAEEYSRIVNDCGGGEVLMDASDLASMRINGMARDGLALAIHDRTNLSVIRPIRFYEDVEVRAWLGMTERERDGRSYWDLADVTPERRVMARV